MQPTLSSQGVHTKGLPPKATWTRDGSLMILFGVFSAGLSFGLVVGATEYLRVDSRLAYACAVVVVSLVNFFACRRFIFESTSEGIVKQALKFVSSIGFFRVAEIVAFAALATLHVNYRIAFFVVVGLSAAAKIFVARSYVFPRG